MTTEDVILPLDPDPLVLVVDDELTPRSIVARMVRSLGYRTRSCQSGLAALRYLKTHLGQVRLLLADLGMPRMDGGELAERAKDIDCSLIAVPGDPPLGDLLSGYGDLPFVPKPVSFGDLAEKLERLIGIPAKSTVLSRVFAVEGRGRDLFAAAERLDLEGLVAKRKNDRGPLVGA